MSYGFSITNNLGKELYNEASFIPSLVASGTATSSTPYSLFGGSGYTGVVNFSDTVERPLVFVKFESSSNIFLRVSGISNTGFSFSGVEHINVYTRPTNYPSVTIQYEVYANSRYVASSGAYGYQVFNSSNQKIFESSRKALKLSNVNIPTYYHQAGTVNTGNAFNITSQYTGLTTPWFLANSLANTAGVSRVYPAVNARIFYFTARTNGNNFQTSVYCGDSFIISGGQSLGPQPDPSINYWFPSIPIIFS